MVLGEAVFGAGVGSSFVVGLQLNRNGAESRMISTSFTGRTGFSNNIAIMFWDYNGRKCPCGKKGAAGGYCFGHCHDSQFQTRVGKDRWQAEFGLDQKTLG